MRKRTVVVDQSSCNADSAVLSRLRSARRLHVRLDGVDRIHSRMLDDASDGASDHVLHQ